MVITKVITTEQKQILDDLFEILGVDVNQLLLINNMQEVLDKVSKLENIIIKQNEVIDNLTKSIMVLEEDLYNHKENLDGGIFEYDEPKELKL